MLLLLLSLFMVNPYDVQASCGLKRPSFEKREKAADLIFTGKLNAPLVDVQDGPKGTNMVASVEVLKIYKGTISSGNINVYVYIPPTPSCDMEQFSLASRKEAPKEEILFYAKAVDGRYKTSLRMGSHFVFSGYAKKDLEKLNNKNK